MSDGLRAEIEFRTRHFDSLLKWMNQPPELVMKYEDIIGNEETAFRQLGRFYGLNFPEVEFFVRQAVKKLCIEARHHACTQPKKRAVARDFSERDKRAISRQIRRTSASDGLQSLVRRKKRIYLQKLVKKTEVK